MTCLPAAALKGAQNDILYVDDGDGRSVQPFFDQAFQMMGILDRVDRYDVRVPSSSLGNGPGARVTDVLHRSRPTTRRSSGTPRSSTTAPSVTVPARRRRATTLRCSSRSSTTRPGAGVVHQRRRHRRGLGELRCSVRDQLRSVYMNFNLLTRITRRSVSASTRSHRSPAEVPSRTPPARTRCRLRRLLGDQPVRRADSDRFAVTEMLYANNPLYARHLADDD